MPHTSGTTAVKRSANIDTLNCKTKKLRRASHVSSKKLNSHSPKVPREMGKKFDNKSLDKDIWFDGVSPALIAASKEDQSATTKSLVKPSSFTGPTRRIAIDCEFVGVGYEGKEDALARVSVVNQFGHVLLDTLVRPEERVTDYRTRYSGIRPSDLRLGGTARPFQSVHQEVAQLCKGRVVVGHSVGYDLKVLMISHPRRDIRDTSRYRPFRALFGGRIPSLRLLTEKVLGIQVQAGEHDSVEDARAAMRLYTSVKRVWESGKKGRVALKPLFEANGKKEAGLVGESSDCSTIPSAAYLNPLDEYESGLPPVELSATTPSVSNSSTSLTKRAPPVMDTSRNRRCSKKRQKFLQKRRRRGHFVSAQL